MFAVVAPIFVPNARRKDTDNFIIQKFRPETILAIHSTLISDESIISVGIPIAVSIILLAFASTGIYVFIANREFDQTEQRILRKNK